MDNSNLVLCGVDILCDVCQEQLILVKLESSLLESKIYEFLLRQEVLQLYREIFRSIRHVPDEITRKELKEWARADFKNNMHHTDEVAIKSMLHYGKKSLKDLQHSLALSKS